MRKYITYSSLVFFSFNTPISSRLAFKFKMKLIAHTQIEHYLLYSQKEQILAN
ncbi:hypothetical protein VCRA2128O305_370004 [Vibrio crassostreae]|nr:hypothetical protein VCRA2112O187_140069 [Vibrio crassostreae]CAK1922584.1 hypothetical protein VCRA2112E186_230026 [Vibrio crassostreae]CAK1927268.1 hypothetical protein VCRA2112O185_220068 [Vibrio crassostreae]CAK1929255.1 hypothetical protein VCRA2118O239_240004 [Vibrio crassostreae]CAK1933950.1 hypothetical protein VCRA2119O245_260026 [Vibrio crassostreae]